MAHQDSSTRYKEEPVSNPDLQHPGITHHHQIHQQHSQPSHHHQQQIPSHPAASSTPGALNHPQQQQYSRSAQSQSNPSSSYPSPHLQQHQSPYAQPSSISGSQHTAQDSAHYYQSPYGTPTSAPAYSPQDTPDMMAASHAMSRPAYPAIYHTPQSNSPVSVASPTAADHRSIYTTPPLSAQMYAYQPYPAISAPHQTYATHAPAHGMTTQPMLMSQAQSQSMTATKHAMAPLPQQKINTSTPLHAGSPIQASPRDAPASQPSSGGTTSNAAPGPIPATTPLVVRQDQNGVQWIAFEYSRDRVKMEYTIRCDVESVDVSKLSPAFKTENCVYPRACCSKDQYTGNRLQYETECNNVGWALAELNECLRGKRGLIQRAVDSWRNSNQDPRMRSRRVRRMAKINSRRAAAAQHQSQMGAVNPMMGAVNAPLGMVKGGLISGVPPVAAMHHHHPPPVATNGDSGNVSHHHGYNTSQEANGSGQISPQASQDVYGNGHHHHAPSSDATDSRPRQMFNDGYSGYPLSPSNNASLPPVMHDPLDPIHSNGVSTSNSQTDLFGNIPDHKKRKFILVDDPDRGTRVRVRVMLDQVRTKEMPESARKANSVYPRSFVSSLAPPPTQEPNANMIMIPMLDGTADFQASTEVFGARRKKEEDLNELGYRMSWSQPRVFEHRPIFLQRALDAYRNKMRSSMMAAGYDVLETAPHLETRPGKRKWQESRRRSRSGSA